MDGLMQEYPLTLQHVFDRVGAYHGKTEIVSRWPDRSVHRTTYADFHKRTQKLANALLKLGVKPGDRVATLAWNHARHLEAYFAVPLIGAVLHTLNPRLSPADLTYIMNDAGDSVLLVDDVLLPVFDRFKNDVKVREVLVWAHGSQPVSGTRDYEQTIEAASATLAPQKLAEEQAAGLCYTSGTTGRPKGVLYSHRALVLHSIVSALPDALDLSRSDVVLPVVPMFHVNAWGLPVTCALIGAKQVFPGPHLDAQSLLELFASEKVTVTAGVPTVWLGILEALDKNPRGWDTRSLRQMVVGGAAAPQAMIEGYQKRHGLKILHAWGMTEMTPIGTVCRLTPAMQALPEAEQYKVRATQGLAVPLVDIRAVSDAGEVPWDGKTMGELHVRGPWIAKSYFNNPAEEDKFTKDGWFRTGDIVTIDADGYVKITDRSKDLIKSGGEWISSVELENALIGHPAVKEAAVVAAPHPKWDERPAAFVVLKEGQTTTPDELRAYLEPRFAKFWLPDTYLFVAQLPKTATGKLLKSALREQVKASG